MDNLNFLSRMPSGPESRCLTGPPSELSSQESSQKTPSPPTETPPFNISPSQDLHYLETPLSKPELGTLSAILSFAVSKYGDERCFASRNVASRATGGAQSRVRGKDAGGPPIEDSAQTRGLVTVGEWEYLTYSQVGKIVSTLSAGLKQVVKGRLHMFGRNRSVSTCLRMSTVDLLSNSPEQRKLVYAQSCGVNVQYSLSDTISKF
jgi:hypothetical protein